MQDKYAYIPQEMTAANVPPAPAPTLAQVMRKHGVSFVETGADIFGRGRSVATIKGEMFVCQRQAPTGPKSSQFKSTFMRTGADTERLTKILGEGPVNEMVESCGGF